MFENTKKLRHTPILFEQDQNNQNDYNDDINDTNDLDENDYENDYEKESECDTDGGSGEERETHSHFTPPPKIEFTDHAPIERKGLQGSGAILMYALLALSLICLPFSLLGLAGLIQPQVFNLIGFAACMVLLVYFSRSAKLARGMVPMMVFFGIVLFSMTGTAAPALFLVATLFFISQGAFLLTVMKKSQLALFGIIPVAAYATSLGLTVALGYTDPVFCAVCLLPVPAAIVLSGTTHSAARREGITRVGSICATSLALGLTIAAALAVLMYINIGSISLDAVNTAMESFRSALYESLTSVAADIGKGPEQIIPDDIALELVNATVNLLPGTLITVINILVFLAQVILLGTLRTWGVIEKPVRKMFEFSMSFMSAAIFTVALIILIIDSGYEKSTLVGTVANNLTVIFQPGLALCGIDFLTRHMVERRHGCGLVLLAGLILILSVIMNFLLAALAALGAYSIIKAFIADIKAKKANKS